MRKLLSIFKRRRNSQNLPEENLRDENISPTTSSSSETPDHETEPSESSSLSDTASNSPDETVSVSLNRQNSFSESESSPSRHSSEDTDRESYADDSAPDTNLKIVSRISLESDSIETPSSSASTASSLNSRVSGGTNNVGRRLRGVVRILEHEANSIANAIMRRVAIALYKETSKSTFYVPTPTTDNLDVQETSMNNMPYPTAPNGTSALSTCADDSEGSIISEAGSLAKSDSENSLLDAVLSVYSEGKLRQFDLEKQTETPSPFYPIVRSSMSQEENQHSVSIENTSDESAAEYSKDSKATSISDASAKFAASSSVSGSSIALADIMRESLESVKRIQNSSPYKASSYSSDSESSDVESVGSSYGSTVSDISASGVDESQSTAQARLAKSLNISRPSIVLADIMRGSLGSVKLKPTNSPYKASSNSSDSESSDVESVGSSYGSTVSDISASGVDESQSTAQARLAKSLNISRPSIVLADIMRGSLGSVKLKPTNSPYKASSNSSDSESSDVGIVGSSYGSTVSDTSTSSIEFEFSKPNKSSPLPVSSETLASSEARPSFSKKIHRDQPLLDKILQSTKTTLTEAIGTTAISTHMAQKVVGDTKPARQQLTFNRTVSSKTDTKSASSELPKTKFPSSPIPRSSASTPVDIKGVSGMVSTQKQGLIKDASSTKKKPAPISVEGPSVQKLKEAFAPEVHTNVARIIAKLGQTPTKHVLASERKDAPTAVNTLSDSKSIASSRSNITKSTSKANDDASQNHERKQSTSSSSFVNRISEGKSSGLRKVGKVRALIDAYEGKGNPSQGQGHFSSKIGNESSALDSSNTAPKGRF